MLIEFMVGNYLSFKSIARLSMVTANPIKEFTKENTFLAGQYKLLKSAVIYGANASGKSNLLSAMAFMQWFVLNSSKEMQVEDKIHVEPFKLDTTTENAPSYFEVCFLLKNHRYRYGFEVDKKAVIKEWLFCTKRKKENVLFLREGDGIDVNNEFKEGKGLEDKTRDNALFLSVAAQFNGLISGDILKWFMRFRPLYGLEDKNYEIFTLHLLQNEDIRPLLVNFIRQADVGIEDIIVDEVHADDNTPKGLLSSTQSKVKFKISTVHQKFRDGKQEGFTNLDFLSEESDGTKKFFRIAGPLIDSLVNGYVVYIDELDAKLHPLLTKAIVNLFNSSDGNPGNAQLIFVTHDTNLLQYGNLRRDQIWFTEKNQQSATELYTLAEFKLPEGDKVRKDANFETNYIRGKYGAIPYLGDMKALLESK